MLDVTYTGFCYHLESVFFKCARWKTTSHARHFNQGKISDGGKLGMELPGGKQDLETRLIYHQCSSAVEQIGSYPEVSFLSQ